MVENFKTFCQQTMGSHGLFLATLFPIPARFISCDPNTIDFPIYRLHNVRYI